MSDITPTFAGDKKKGSPNIGTTRRTRTIKTIGPDPHNPIGFGVTGDGEEFSFSLSKSSSNLRGSTSTRRLTQTFMPSIGEPFGPSYS